MKVTTKLGHWKRSKKTRCYFKWFPLYFGACLCSVSTSVLIVLLQTLGPWGLGTDRLQTSHNPANTTHTQHQLYLQLSITFLSCCPCPQVVSLCPLFTAEATLNVSPDEYLIRVCCHVPRVLHSTSHITSLLNMSPLLETWQYLFRTWIYLDIFYENLQCCVTIWNLCRYLSWLMSYHSLYIYSKIFKLINISVLHFVLSILIMSVLKSINFGGCCQLSPPLCVKLKSNYPNYTLPSELESSVRAIATWIIYWALPLPLFISMIYNI